MSPEANEAGRTGVYRYPKGAKGEQTPETETTQPVKGNKTQDNKPVRPTLNVWGLVYKGMSEDEGDDADREGHGEESEIKDIVSE
jgi:hypothetical protein